MSFRRVGKAEIIGETTGFMNVVTDRGIRRLSECTVVGPDAENLIYGASIVVGRGGTVNEIGRSVGNFPTRQGPEFELVHWPQTAAERGIHDSGPADDASHFDTWSNPAHVPFQVNRRARAGGRDHSLRTTYSRLAYMRRLL